MRPNKRLTFFRVSTAIVAVFSTSAFILNLLNDVSGYERDVTLIARSDGKKKNEAEEDITGRNLTFDPDGPHFRSSGERGILLKEVERLRMEVRETHKQLMRLQHENLRFRQRLISMAGLPSSGGNKKEISTASIGIRKNDSTTNQTSAPSGEYLLENIFNLELVLEKLTASEILRGGQSLKNEYELTPFARFTSDRVYLVEPGFEKRVVEKPIGFKRRALKRTINTAVAWLNRNRNLAPMAVRGTEVVTPVGVLTKFVPHYSGAGWSTSSFNKSPSSSSRSSSPSSSSSLLTMVTRPSLRSSRMYLPGDFLEGIYRTVPGLSEHYELYFRDLDAPRSYRVVSVARVFSSPVVVSSKLQSVTFDLIHIVIPLQGRVAAFQQFMERFEIVCVRANENVFLTIVHFGGGEEFEVLNSIVDGVRSRTSFQNVRLMSLSGEFSRGQALSVGATREIPGVLDNRDVLLFFCDVDVIFTSDFLQRCRLNAEAGVKVYYPIVFSLYNPNITHLYAGDDDDRDFYLERIKTTDAKLFPSRNSTASHKSKSRQKTMTISVDSGFWRDFGYGMTCQYLSDFKNSGGFDAKHKGWGMEDVYLYRKYVRSRLFVVRATDHGIFHVWHDKVCPQDLPADQYRSCIRSKALNEASHAQLGMLLFKKEIENNLLKSRVNTKV